MSEEEPLQHGDRVEDVDTGRTGTYEGGAQNGPKIRWDDEPHAIEICFEGELRKIPEDGG